MSSVQLKTYAKINLSLDVTGVRENGYHEVAMVMQAVDLYDEMTVEVFPAKEDRILLTIDDPEIPADSRNTAYKAAEVMMELWRMERIAKQEESRTEEGDSAVPAEGSGQEGTCTAYEVRIDICKRIPAAAGLAGGSSNAAGVILALNLLLDMNFTMDQLCSAGEKIGADVPFCILSAAACQQDIFGLKGGSTCALAEGIGEILTPLRSVLFHVVLAKPPAGVSTAQVYRELDDIEIPEHPKTRNLIEGIASGNMQKIKSSMCNVLENVTFRLCPESGSLKEQMSGKGSLVSMMSGSGPTVYALFSSQAKAAAMASALRGLKQDGYRIILTKTL